MYYILRWFLGERSRYEVYYEFLLPLIVIRTLGHILCQVLVAKIPIGHEGDSNPRTSDLESDTLAPYQQAVIKDGYHEGRLSHPDFLAETQKATFFQQSIALSISVQSGSTIAKINRLDVYN